MLGYEVIITLDIQYLTLVGGYQETVIFTTDAIPGWGQLVSNQRQTDVNCIIALWEQDSNQASCQIVLLFKISPGSRGSQVSTGRHQGSPSPPSYSLPATISDWRRKQIRVSLLNPLTRILSKASGTKEGLQYRGE